MEEATAAAASAECNTGLGLGLGMSEYVPKKRHGQQQKPLVQFNLLFPPKEEAVQEEEGDMDQWSSKNFNGDDEHENKNTSTCSNSNKLSTRKKLRLTKEQTNLLENSFKEHSTPPPTQKIELAEKLNLRPRQVEVWFQNRRARTKLKQTEVDCEFLKKCCESLSDENRRLKRELQELRLMKLAGSSPFYFQLPKGGTLTMCPSCQRETKTGESKTMAVLGGS